MRIDSVCQSESGRLGACFSSTVFVRSLRVHLYGVGTHSLSLSQPLTRAICNAVMWSTVSLCPLHGHARTHDHAELHTHTRTRVHTHRRSMTFRTTTSGPAKTHINMTIAALIVRACVSNEKVVLRGFIPPGCQTIQPCFEI